MMMRKPIVGARVLIHYNHPTDPCWTGEARIIGVKSDPHYVDVAGKKPDGEQFKRFNVVFFHDPHPNPHVFAWWAEWPPEAKAA